MKALIYDIEIKKAIQGKNETRMDGIDYCGGWNDHANMGISVIGAYDFHEERYRVFCDDNKEAFFALCDSSDLLITFNGIGFDDQVIKKCWTSVDFNPGEKSYDILVEIRKAAGSYAGFSLDATCAVNFNTRKTGNGALAPILWQQGKIGAVIDYCLNDVALTKQCFHSVCQHGGLLNPKETGQFLTMRKPV